MRVTTETASARSTSSSGSVSVGAHGRAPVPASEVRPLPWREAERKGVGGYPKPPPKRAAPSLDSPAGRGQRLGRVPPKPPPKRAAPSLDSPAWMGADRARRCTPSHHQRGLRPLWTLPPGWERTELGGCTPKPPPKRAAPSLDSPAGWERTGVWGYPQTPTKEGCALFGLSRRAGSPSVAWAPMRNRSGSAASPPHFSLINE